MSSNNAFPPPPGQRSCNPLITAMARLRCIRSRATFGIVLTALAVAILAGAPHAAAAPTDNVLIIPVAGLATGPTGLRGPLVAQHVTATTGTETPGITRFSGTEGTCACMIHWRNLTTGAVGDANLWFGFPATGGTAITGSGILVATVTTSGVGWPITILPGAGFWTVP